MKSELTVYIISGPLGVGKTSVTRHMAEKIDKAVLIEGDLFLHALDRQDWISWEDKLRISWENIIAATRIYLNRGLYVVIDFVVEDELEWFSSQLSDLGVTISYHVLIADKQILEDRLTKRSEIKYLDRSLVLLEKLQSNPRNEVFLIDTSYLSVDEVVTKIIG